MTDWPVDVMVVAMFLIIPASPFIARLTMRIWPVKEEKK